jgi:hypothetical protein
MNITENRVSAVLSNVVLAQIIDLLKQVIELMPFLVGLTPEERKRMPKMDKRNREFVHDVEIAIKNDGSILPGYIKPEEMTKDLELYEQLEEVLVPLNYLSDRVRDTQILVGSEAYSTALLVYNMVKTADKAGVPGANNLYKQLKERFERTGSKDQDEQE